MLNRLLKFPIHLWRRMIAPVLPPCCRFYPSCSEYALQALDRHPCHHALGLIVWRLMRCNPWHPGGYDPVPEDKLHRHPSAGSARTSKV